MNILFLGDVVARSGRDAVISYLPQIKKQYSADFTIINGENSAHGKGITSKIYRQLKEAGADVITLGNHTFSKSEIIGNFSQCPDMIRPANLEPADIGKPYIIRECRGRRIAVVNLLGTVFMDIAAGDPVTAMNSLLQEIDADIIIVDLHAEATSEKQVFYHIFRSRVTAVIGTHTHVQTADEQVTDGCAYITDAGMCGPFDSILGRDTDEVIRRMVYREQTRFTPSDKPAVICGILIRTDDATNRCISAERIQIRPEMRV
ncbi:MAG: TIGR00282 family metallophosphoesterase [Solobacterium sp.]|nr:TIGR00282 family metallophosphoesterase [Solobacterium sp.]